MAGHDVRAGPPSGPNGSAGVTVCAETTTLGLGRAPAVAMLGAGGPARRRRGSRWRLRDWRLRTKLTAVLLVPLVLAGVLGALRVTDLVRQADDFAALARQIGFAQQLGVLVHDLQAERVRVAAMLVASRGADRAGLQTQVQRVDAAVATLQGTNFDAGSRQATGDGQLAAVHRAALNQLSGLPALRQATLQPNATAPDATARNAVDAYSNLIAVLLDLNRKILDSAPHPLDRQADGIKALAVAKEQASWQHAVLLTGILSDGLPAEQQVTLRTADARFDAAADEFGQTVSSAQRQPYFNTRAVVDRKRLLDAALDRAAREAPLETLPGSWNSAAAGTVETIRQGETTLLNELRTSTVARSDRAWNAAFWAGVVVAALLVLAVLLLVVVVRSLLQQLRTLRTAAFEVADRRLPEAVEQLRAADGIPSETTVDPVPVHSREEVGQVARAFDTVHVQAVRLAAEQAQLRSSLNDIFLNLSGRSQGLMERQLQLIDELRRTAHDSEQVSGLLQLDRLAARMRRHSETLLVLAGGTVRRGADGPVAVLDVFNCAVSEIEAYQQVTVCPPPAAMVAGRVANDLVHLIAELLDNATSVAPQGTTVTLGGALTEDKSLLVEITDSGPGLHPDKLQAINARLASAPAVDASSSGQMGLFVVSGLAAQHGLTVRLRQRLGGSGITATVLLPPSLVTVDLRVSTDPHVSGDSRGPDSAPDSASGSAVGAPAAPGRSGTGEQLPLQVSVIDEATVVDLFSPASIGVVTPQRSRPRTAQEEWLELFGHREPQPEHEPGFDQLSGVAAATDPLGGGSPVSGQPQEVREEIFEAVSAWFREQRSASLSTPPPTAAPEWQSPFDEGWQAAQALRTPVDHGFTPAGLPKREPRAHLVSGVDGGVSPPAPPGPARTPDAVRGRLSRYQRGLRVGRHALIAPDDINPYDLGPHELDPHQIGTNEQPAWADTPQRPSDQRPFEEN
ncbi:MAG: nitrate- and nitrite sensing domain-containing protein [Actinomycetota bacterium]|nr:nitrate- and nitrite sensing domain-containing protein [Actinomycetota bacterium]